MDSSLSDNPIILYAMLVVGVLTIVLGALSKGTTGFGSWLSSLRRIGADAKEADIQSRNVKIANLSADLDSERKARQADRIYFEKEVARRDKLSREHVRWDWDVYNVLIRAGLWDNDQSSGPPPLY